MGKTSKLDLDRDFSKGYAQDVTPDHILTWMNYWLGSRDFKDGDYHTQFGRVLITAQLEKLEQDKSK